MKRTFRPTIKHWIKEIGSLLIYTFFAVVIFVAPIVYGLDEFFNDWPFLIEILPIGTIVFLLLAFVNLLGLVHSLWLVISVDADCIKGRLGMTQSFEVKWSDVIAAWLEVDDNKNTNLILSTTRRSALVRLYAFDADVIWREVEQHVSPDALKKTAKDSSGEIVWNNLLKELNERVLAQPLKVVSQRGARRLGLVVLIFFSVIFLLSLFDTDSGSLMIFSLFIALGLGLIGVSSTIKMSADTIMEIRFLKRRQIQWDEIHTISIGAPNESMVFQSHDMKLAIDGPESWSGSDRENMIHWLTMQIEKHDIEFEQHFLSYLHSLIFSHSQSPSKNPADPSLNQPSN